MPLSPAPSASATSPAKARPQLKNRAPSETGTASSSSTRASMQQMLRQILSRPTATGAVDQYDADEGRRAQRAVAQEHGRSSMPQLQQPRPTLQSQNSPAALPLMSWPMARQDEAQHESLMALMRAWEQNTQTRASAKDLQASRMAAQRGVIAYQTYLRGRMVDVGTQLQEFKEQYEDVLAASPTMVSTQESFKEINGPAVLSRSHAQSPFDKPEVMLFLMQQECREEALEEAIKKRVAAIRRNHDGPLTLEVCRARLMQEALQELVEKDLIQYYMEMTLLTRCQLTAIAARARLSVVE